LQREGFSDCLRRRRTFWQRFRPGDGTDASELSAPEAAAVESAALAALDRAMAEVDSADRLLLEAKYHHHESVRSIAARLSLSVKAVESRLSRARAAVRTRVTSILKHHG
jgi:DNA-directed RNA polymerase specialized sigma24 family protein